MSGTATLTRQGKAALILRLLLGDGQGLSLADMPEETQIALAREMGRLGSVDKDTIDQVAGEFADQLEKIGLGPAGGVSKVIDGLADFLSPEVAERMRNEARNGPPPEPWAYVLSLELSELEPIMERETIETAAVVLSRLPVAKAAPLLGLLPGERARRIAYAVSRIGTIAPQTVALIGAALSRAYTRPAQSAFPDDPSQRIGDILNAATASTRDDLLADIASNDPAFAKRFARQSSRLPISRRALPAPIFQRSCAPSKGAILRQHWPMQPPQAARIRRRSIISSPISRSGWANKSAKRSRKEERSEKPMASRLSRPLLRQSARLLMPARSRCARKNPKRKAEAQPKAALPTAPVNSISEPHDCGGAWASPTIKPAKSPTG